MTARSANVLLLRLDGNSVEMLLRGVFRCYVVACSWAIIKGINQLLEGRWAWINE